VLALLPATVLVGAFFDERVWAEWLAPGRLEPLVYSLGIILAGIAVGAAGCHMAWQTRRNVHAARRVGKYRLKVRIGSGAMGDVWLARQEVLGRDVAVKVLRKERDDGRDARRRFEREAKAASVLQHPNTIRVIEYGVAEDDSCFIAMELLDGVDLAMLVERSGRLLPARAIHLAVQACASLAEAHEHGIIHRDIKPANLFVSRVGEEDDFVKVLDFGIARMVEAGGVGMTKLGAIVGSPGYMAPEACRGERADARTDLYSLGAVLYFMLSGHEVFPDRPPLETVLAHLKQDPPPLNLSPAEGGPSGDLEAIVLRCLAKDPSARFQTARDLEHALRACPEYRPSARRVDPGKSVRRLRRSEPPPSSTSAEPPRPEAGGAAAPAAKAAPAAALTMGSRETEERRRALEYVAWITCLIAWPFFVVTDVLDALFTHRTETLPTLLALRCACALVSIALLICLRRGGLSRRALALCDVGAFLAFAFFVSLEGVLLPGFEERALLGIMIVAFVRAALVPSHWTRAFAISVSTTAVFPAVLFVAGLGSPHLAAQWGAEAGVLAYGLGQVIATAAMGAVASHMTWRAERELLEARKLGQYRLKARIASGATGDVWLARQDALDRNVALKVLRTRGDDERESLRRFAREAKVASSLRHPNTIRIFEYGASDDGVYFIAMELLDGVELDKLVKERGPLGASDTIHLAIQACGSLTEAHKLGVVHRDIKPANLFVTHVGEDRYFLKLLDFGIAQMVEGDAGSSLGEDGIFGTPAYISPEACCGEPIDARSDIYSLGAVLYYVLSGTEVFPGQTFAQLASHVETPPEPLSVRLQASGRTIPADLERIVMRCLSKKPEERFAAARELEDALRDCVDCRDGEPHEARAA
jgi:serine/threonine-protein kinase